MANDYFNHDAPVVRHTLGRAEAVNASFVAVASGFDKLPAPEAINQGRITYVVDSGAANAYVVALSSAPESYTAGLSFVMKAANANTGTSTVNVNSLGVKPIKRYDGSDLSASDIVAGMLVHLGYDGTNFLIIGTLGAEATLAKDWANKTSGTVAGGEFSSKEYAQGSQSGTGGSAKNWAQESGSVTGASANDRSAKSWAQAALTGATLGGSAKDWAQTTGATVDGTNHSAKAHAQSEGLIAAGSAKEWATKTTAVADGLKGARGYAQDASTSATNSATSASNAASHYNAFRGIFYGANSSDPSLDPNGNAPGAGDWYFNTTVNGARQYNGSAWQDIGAARLSTFAFTAAGGETSLSGADDDGNTLTYTPGFLQVFKNGMLLTPSDDYTATTGTSITELTALSASDVVVVQAFATFSINTATVTTTAISKTLATSETCIATTSGLTLTLPASPSAGDEVRIGVDDFTDTTVGRNGQPIMEIAEDMTIDRENVIVTFKYINGTIGWRVA